jgi:hypothetical protein
MEVRCASPFDLSQIAATLVRMHREAEFDLAPINSHTLMATVNNTIHNGVVLVAVDEGRVVGTIGGTTGRDWWSDDEYFSDLWFYVSSEARASQSCHPLDKEICLGDPRWVSRTQNQTGACLFWRYCPKRQIFRETWPD